MSRIYPRRTMLGMALVAAAALLLSGTLRLIGRQSSPSPSQRGTLKVIIGRAVSANGQVMNVLTREGTIRVTLNGESHVWKKAMRSDFAAILPGDVISGRGTLDVFGNIVATDLWANIERFEGEL